MTKLQRRTLDLAILKLEAGAHFPNHTFCVMEAPVLAAETRAWRKAAQKAVSPWFLRHPLLAKIAALWEAERLGPQGPPAAVEEVVVPEAGVQPITPPTAPVVPIPPAPASMVRHNPSKVCELADEHPFADCGYNRPRPPEAA